MISWLMFFYPQGELRVHYGQKRAPVHLVLPPQGELRVHYGQKCAPVHPVLPPRGLPHTRGHQTIWKYNGQDPGFHIQMGNDYECIQAVPSQRNEKAGRRRNHKVHRKGYWNLESGWIAVSVKWLIYKAMYGGSPNFMKGFYKIVLLHCFTSSLMFFIVCQCEKQHWQ